MKKKTTTKKTSSKKIIESNQEDLLENISEIIFQEKYIAIPNIDEGGYLNFH